MKWLKAKCVLCEKVIYARLTVFNNRIICDECERIVHVIIYLIN